MFKMRILCMCVFILMNIDLCFSKIFKIAWIVPGSNETNYINSETSVGALKLALKAVFNNKQILNGHTIKIKHFNTECSAQSAMRATMLARTSFDPDVIIGPPCTEAMKVVAQLTSFWNLPTLSWYNPEIEFDKQKVYPTLLRLSPPNHIMGQSLLHLLNQHSWKKFSLIYHSDLMWVDLKSTIEAAVLPTDIRVRSTHQVDSNTTDREMQHIFTEIKKYTSIIVFACPYHLIRQYMLAADKVGMGNGEFVFIQLDHQIYSDTMLNTQVIGDGAWRRGDMYDNAARKIMESLIHVMIDPMNDNTKPTNALPKSRYTDFVRLVTGSVINNANLELPVAGKPDVYSLYLYDTVMVWAILMDMIDTAGQDYRNANIVSSYVTKSYANGATGYIVVDADLDRLGKIFILDMNSDGQFKPVQILKFNTTTNYDVLNTSPITTMYRWGNGKPGSHFTPTDEPAPELTKTKIAQMHPTTSRAALSTKPANTDSHAESLSITLPISSGNIRRIMIQSPRKARGSIEQTAKQNSPDSLSIDMPITLRKIIKPIIPSWSEVYRTIKPTSTELGSDALNIDMSITSRNVIKYIKPQTTKASRSIQQTTKEIPNDALNTDMSITSGNIIKHIILQTTKPARSIQPTTKEAPTDTLNIDMPNTSKNVIKHIVPQTTKDPRSIDPTTKEIPTDTMNIDMPITSKITIKHMNPQTTKAPRSIQPTTNEVPTDTLNIDMPISSGNVIKHIIPQTTKAPRSIQPTTKVVPTDTFKIDMHITSGNVMELRTPSAATIKLPSQPKLNTKTRPTESFSSVMSRLKSLEQKLVANHGHGEHIPFHTHTPHPFLAKLTTPATILKPIQQQQQQQHNYQSHEGFKNNTQSNVNELQHLAMKHTNIISSKTLSDIPKRMKTKNQTKSEIKSIPSDTPAKNTRQKITATRTSLSAIEAKLKKLTRVQMEQLIQYMQKGINKVPTSNIQTTTTVSAIKETSSVKPITKPVNSAIETEVELEDIVPTTPATHKQSITFTPATINKPVTSTQSATNEKLVISTQATPNQSARLRSTVNGGILSPRTTQNTVGVTGHHSNASPSDSLIDRISSRILNQLTGKITNSIDQMKQTVNNLTASVPSQGVIGDWMASVVDEMPTRSAIPLHFTNMNQNVYGYQRIPFNQYPLYNKQTNMRPLKPNQAVVYSNDRSSIKHTNTNQVNPSSGTIVEPNVLASVNTPIQLDRHVSLRKSFNVPPHFQNNVQQHQDSQNPQPLQRPVEANTPQSNIYREKYRPRYVATNQPWWSFI